MQEDDRDQLDVQFGELPRQVMGLPLIERDQHVALGVDALLELEAQLGGNERPVLAEVEVERIRPVDPADLVAVDESP